MEIPQELTHLYAYKQGKYISIRHEDDGHELRRSYSMSSSPTEGRLAVTVKKVEGGKVSTWLHDTIRHHGALGALYPPIPFGMECDTPSFLYFIPNGLGAAEHPDWGSCGGRYGRIADSVGLDFSIDHFFWNAVMAARVITLVSMVLNVVMPDSA